MIQRTLDVLAGRRSVAREKEELTVFAVNRDTDSRCSLRPVSASSPVTGWWSILFSNMRISRQGIRRRPEKVVPHNRGDARVEEGFLRALLPRLSWNVIRMTKL